MASTVSMRARPAPARPAIPPRPAPTGSSAAIGPEAPGLNTGEQLVISRNLAPDAPIPEGAPRTKTGYTGHLPGEKSAYGSTFGRTCGDCLDEFQASVSKTAAAGYRILPLAEFSAAPPITSCDACLNASDCVGKPAFAGKSAAEIRCGAPSGPS